MGAVHEYQMDLPLLPHALIGLGVRRDVGHLVAAPLFMGRLRLGIGTRVEQHDLRSCAVSGGYRRGCHCAKSEDGHEDDGKGTEDHATRKARAA